MPLHIRLIKVVVLRAIARVRRAMTAAHAPATLMMALVILELAAVLPKLVALSRVRRTILACVLVVVIVLFVRLFCFDLQGGLAFVLRDRLYFRLRS